MKNIKALIDTNVILDWVMTREPFANAAKVVMEKCMFGNVKGYLASHTVTDLFYILRKDYRVKERKDLLLLLNDKLEIIAVNSQMIKKALENELWTDLEDGLQMQCAFEEDVDYIVTRNINDFKSSQNKVILTEDFFELIK
jgi:predicted nucleic acid-binding protein